MVTLIPLAHSQRNIALSTMAQFASSPDSESNPQSPDLEPALAHGPAPRARYLAKHETYILNTDMNT